MSIGAGFLEIFHTLTSYGVVSRTNRCARRNVRQAHFSCQIASVFVNSGRQIKPPYRLLAQSKKTNASGEFTVRCVPVSIE